MRSMGFHEGGEVETFGGPLAVDFIFNANKQIRSFDVTEKGIDLVYGDKELSSVATIDRAQNSIMSTVELPAFHGFARSPQGNAICFSRPTRRMDGESTIYFLDESLNTIAVQKVPDVIDPPIISNSEMWVVACADGFIYAFAHTGQALWSIKIDSFHVGLPLLQSFSDDGVIFAGQHGVLSGISTSGEVSWRVDFIDIFKIAKRDRDDSSVRFQGMAHKKSAIVLMCDGPDREEIYVVMSNGTIVAKYPSDTNCHSVVDNAHNLRASWTPAQVHLVNKKYVETSQSLHFFPDNSEEVSVPLDYWPRKLECTDDFVFVKKNQFDLFNFSGERLTRLVDATRSAELVTNTGSDALSFVIVNQKSAFSFNTMEIDR